MYSGMYLTKHTGKILGAHQKIDRIARRRLAGLIDDAYFPKAKEIIKFEGMKGPDSIKVKSPAKNEPWHYFRPFDDSDDKILSIIERHYELLVQHLKKGDKDRSAFEAAWLAHALVDGLTPAHQFPLEEKMTELRGGAGLETRTTYKDKLIMPGNGVKEKLVNNWKMWGAKGLFNAHIMFEMGVAMLILPLKFGEIAFDDNSLRKARKMGVVELFEQVAKEVGALEMYENYLKRGWTSKLAIQVRNVLMPQLVTMVTVAWFLAAQEAGIEMAGQLA